MINNAFNPQRAETNIYRRHRVQRAVKLLEMAERTMTRAQITEAQKLARDWSPAARPSLVSGAPIAVLITAVGPSATSGDVRYCAVLEDKRRVKATFLLRFITIAAIRFT